MDEELNLQDLEAVAGGFHGEFRDYIAKEGETINKIASKTHSSSQFLIDLNYKAVIQCYKKRYPNKSRPDERDRYDR